MDMTRKKNIFRCKCYRTFFSLVLTGLFVVAFHIQAIASSSMKEIKLSAPVVENLHYTLGLLDADPNEKIISDKFAPIIDFISSSSKTWPALYYSGDNFSSQSSYHEFDINQGLEEIVKYAYSGSIPSQAVIPSSVRLSYWKNSNGKQDANYWNWNFPVSEDHIQIVRGIQHEETTPDMSSWTYYSYDLDRLLILSRYKGQNVFFSISRQQDKAAGKKAFALGGDKDWNYLYTREKGVNRAGLGWVTPYMYESFSITVFIEKPDKSSVKCAMFKWLNAGAGNINMVKKFHIYEGIKRFEAGFKMVLENPNLPNPKEMAAVFRQIGNLQFEDMKYEISEYFRNLKDRYHQDAVFKDKNLAEFFTSPEYLDQLTKEEMRSILGLEYMKTILRKQPIIRINRLLSQLSKSESAL